MTKVVHVAQTPLVGAPMKVATALRRIGYESSSIIYADYPKKGPLSNKFIGESMVWSDADEVALNTIKILLLEADIIHIHNDVSEVILEYIKERCSGAKFIYQVHSPLREGPLYCERAESIGLPFGAKLVVSQYQPRHYTDYFAVPNIVLDTPAIRLRKRGEKLRVLFSPSHARKGRWNCKYSEKLANCLESLTAVGVIEAVTPKAPISPFELMSVRKTCHVSIDEIVTGAYHQVSLEGMCAGNVVINRADYFSKAMLANMVPSNSMPPFVYADEVIIEDVLLKLALDVDLTNSIQSESYDYFVNNLSPELMANIYKEIYENRY